MSRIKRILFSLAATLGLLAPATVPSLAGAQSRIEDGLCQGVQITIGDGCDLEGDEAEERAQGIIELVINIFSLVVGIVAVIMLVVGGLKYITSNGDPGNVTGAKNTILYAVIGLVIVALAQLIVRFVLNRAQNAAPAGP